MSTTLVLCIWTVVACMILSFRHRHGYDGKDADGERTGCHKCQRKRETFDVRR